MISFIVEKMKRKSLNPPIGEIPAEKGPGRQDELLLLDLQDLPPDQVGHIAPAPDPRHVELQIVGNGKGAVSTTDRKSVV